jgi:hypothetical protein
MRVQKAGQKGPRSSRKSSSTAAKALGFVSISTVRRKSDILFRGYAFIREEQEAS